MSFSAKIVADSINQFGMRITSPLTTFPRFILAELNTHCMLARNSASSRAIPFDKMVSSVKENPFIPIAWMRDHKGMQGEDFFTWEKDIEWLTEKWLEARDAAVKSAELLNKCATGQLVKEGGLSKQICNRLLEPYAWHTVILTATEWQNFFALRAHEAAEIHMQKLAFLMLDEFNKSIPKYLLEGEWHLPFANNIDGEKIKDLFHPDNKTLVDKIIRDTKNFGDPDKANLLKAKISTARCARTSYTVAGEDIKEKEYKSEVEFCDNKLIAPGHWSPFEHPSRSMTFNEFFSYSRSSIIQKDFIDEYKSKNNSDFYEIIKSAWDTYILKEYGWCGKFRGYIQFRKMFSHENKADQRLLTR